MGGGGGGGKMFGIPEINILLNRFEGPEMSDINLEEIMF